MTTIDEELVDQQDGISNCCGAVMYNGRCSDCQEMAVDVSKNCINCNKELSRREHYEQGGLCDSCLEAELLGLGE